jgi:hypothetical protein
MEIKIVIDAPKGWKRRVLLYVVMPLGFVVVAGVAAHAYDTTWIASGQQVSAAALKNDLDEAQTRIAALEAFRAQATADGGYSLGATYCGSTPATNGQITGGYPGARALCQTACGGSPKAHMCTNEELVRTLQTSVASSIGGWYSTGTFVGAYGTGNPVADCSGWTTNSTGFYGAQWDVGSASVSLCSLSQAILCCE